MENPVTRGQEKGVQQHWMCQPELANTSPCLTPFQWLCLAIAEDLAVVHIIAAFA
jgi:hypothetical protein